MHEPPRRACRPSPSWTTASTSSSSSLAAGCATTASTCSRASPGARVWLFDAEPPTSPKPYLEGFTQVDPSDARALTANAQLVAQRVRPSGVLCYHEQYVQSAARVVGALALPGFSSAAIRNCRDKRATRPSRPRRRSSQRSASQPGRPFPGSRAGNRVLERHCYRLPVWRTGAS